METWKPIPGYEGRYDASDAGNVRSFVKNSNGQILKQNASKSGHMYVRLGRKVNSTAHALVLTAFVSPPPEGCECCHNDGNKNNNKLSNLRWDTHKENARDMYRHMLHKNQKLTVSNVMTIKAELARNTKHGVLAQLAKQYGVTISAISCIKRGITYGYLVG